MEVNMANKENTSITIVWEDSVTVDNAQEKKQELLKAFNNNTEILLDISKLEDIDISAVQLIIACQKEANLKGLTFKVVGNITPAFTDFFCRIGIPITDLTCDQLSEKVIETLAGEK